MSKILKYTGILLGIIVLLVVLTMIFLMTFVSPNRLKPVLIEQVSKYTGRQLVMDGDMSWTFFPYLGVKAGHSSLGSPAGFSEKTFAEISHITVGVKLMSLFHGRIESSGIVLDGMKLHLIKNKDGNVNWDFQAITSPGKEASAKTQTNSAVSTKRAAMGLAVSSLAVTQAAIDYSDEQAKKYYHIKNIELHATDINLMQPFPIQSSFDFAANNPAVSGHAVLTGNAALNMAAQIYTFRHLNFSADISQAGRKMNVNVSGDVLVNLNQQTLQWNDFKGKVANVAMTGKVNVSKLTTHPMAAGHLQLLPFDLKQTLQEVGQDVPHLQIAKMVKGDVDFTTDVDGVKAQGNLMVDTLQASQVTITNINVKAHFQKNVLDLAPISANFYQGTLTGQAIVNLSSAVPQMTLHAKLANVQAQPLMEDLGGKDQKIKMAGVSNFEMQLTTAGTEANMILQNLNGVSQFNFKDGSIIGIDLGYLVDSGYAFVKHQPTAAVNTEQTHFGTLSGTAVIRHGVISNNDLFSDTPRFAIRGAGVIDLVNQKIDYSLQAVIKQRADQKDNLMNVYGVTLPILISGNLSSPSIRLDSTAMAKAIAQQQIKKVTNQAKEKLQQQIKKQLPGKAGDLLNGPAGDVLNNFLGN